ncbi:proline--tRNA ligase [Chlamydiifrater phoenicopteri]|uniref:proline--tRNA ligase n=1 Tax=Chlamydiifrater phoenicopteri TaxID=2681469 RepID=UPI001BCD97AA|nr:proline--tRNA ligase [Chlamydiifrater phoenicopteri]
MRSSLLFYKTSKNANKDSQVISNELLEKADYIRKISKGIFSYGPLMQRVVKKFCQIIREELDKVGGQEVCLPILQPAEFWEKTERWQAFSSEGLLYTLKDREQRDFCIAPTHEEIISSLVSEKITSKKQLPIHLYQIAPKFRDEIRPRFGLMRSKELLMEDSYTFSASPEQMEEQYQLLRHAYCNIFDRLNLRYVIVEADGGKIGKGKSEEFQVLCSLGEDTVCVSEQYAANIETARALPQPFAYDKALLPLEQHQTPNIGSIEALQKFFNVAPQKILKTLVFKLLYSEGSRMVAIGIRGDRQVNTAKVCSKFLANEVVPATEEELSSLGTTKGFIGPLNCPIEFFADFSTEPMTNFICAGNEKDIHYLNANWERDFPKPSFADFLLAEEGDICPQNPATPYKMMKGIEVAHIFNLGTRYTEAFNVSFQDEQNTSSLCWMGTYGIGVGRTLASCVEQLSDDKGIVWPNCLAPFCATIIPAGKTQEILEGAETVYAILKNAGYDPLLDDREERFGYKLNDSDFVGIPYKIIIGKSFLSHNLIELESRKGEKLSIKIDELLPTVKNLFSK